MTLLRFRRTFGWTAAWTLVGLLVGCGGSTKHDAAQGSAGSAIERGGSTDGGSAAGGTNGTAASGSGGAPETRTLDGFESSSTHAAFGLWMGFPNDVLPVGMPPSPHDGSALHLVGTTDDAGLDVFFHTPLAVEKIFRSVRFWVASPNAGSHLTVAVAGPDASYFSDRAQGIQWPERMLTLAPTWQEVVVDLRDWGLDPEHLSPHSEYYGAFHFIVEPNTDYDLWIDDFAAQPL
ncbi:MAG: hypothetical protein ABUL60_31785 [Myxococcales bacterium]